MKKWNTPEVAELSIALTADGVLDMNRETLLGLNMVDCGIWKKQEVTPDPDPKPEPTPDTDKIS